MGTIASSRVADDGIAQYCQRAADVIHLRFEAMNAATIECSYFILPSYTDIVSREFGDQDFKRDTQNPLRSQQYSGIMGMLEAATGQLTAIQVTVLKLLIKADPRLLALSSGGKPLPMVLHHAAAGPIHDAALVEWLIQVGALYWQPSAHYRTEKAAAWVDASMLPKYLAIHSAAAAGYLDMVMLLLKAENMRDQRSIPKTHSPTSLSSMAIESCSKYWSPEVQMCVAAMPVANA